MRLRLRCLQLALLFTKLRKPLLALAQLRRDELKRDGLSRLRRGDPAFENLSFLSFACSPRRAIRATEVGGLSPVLEHTHLLAQYCLPVPHSVCAQGTSSLRLNKLGGQLLRSGVQGCNAMLGGQSLASSFCAQSTKLCRKFRSPTSKQRRLDIERCIHDVGTKTFEVPAVDFEALWQ